MSPAGGGGGGEIRKESVHAGNLAQAQKEHWHQKTLLQGTGRGKATEQRISPTDPRPPEAPWSCEAKHPSASQAGGVSQSPPDGCWGVKGLGFKGEPHSSRKGARARATNLAGSRQVQHPDQSDLLPQAGSKGSTPSRRHPTVAREGGPHHHL